ncbi:Metalloenzyme, LuxS/M16 peptidase-like protein [Paraphysoderma sedebokerense]|nr:Metalloenzyme, LuxS/M16 peptidase-like protein [Paraphysoderma sedebokerense]
MTAETIPAPFQLVKSVEYLGVNLTKYRSTQSGLEIVLVDIESPIVNGFFVVATEESGKLIDKGLPHTLEHLVFLGSEDYPYKGVLDSLANRALAHGTNAWTDTDHTCYTITTAGGDGFKNIMPIYLDHILYPTITEYGYVTEVHHINGNGEDAGVVYCEMQGRENSGPDRMHLRMLQLLYPAPSGYRSETGGLMRKLRELDVHQIRSFHKDYYRPDNLRLIITGKVNHTAILNALVKTEEKISKKGKLVPMKRPWVESEPIPPFEKTVEEVVEFPDEDESMGTVVIAYRGPHVTEFKELQILDILFTYFTDSAVSTLHKAFVELEEPYCTDVHYSRGDNLITNYYFSFENVPTENLEVIKTKFFETMHDVVNGKSGRSIDLERMKLTIERKRLKTLDDIETDGHDILTNPVICDFLYGEKKGAQLRDMVDDLAYLDELLLWQSSKWINFIVRYILERPHVVLIGKPSAALAKQIQEDEKARLDKQRSDLGPEKLKQLQERLDHAMQENDKPIPPEMIGEFPTPKLDISFPNVDTGRNGGDMKLTTPLQKQLDGLKNANVPYFIQFDDVHSSFIQISVYFDTRNLTPSLAAYIELYLEAFFILPVTKPDGTKLTHEQVVNGLNTDTVYHSNDCGLGGSNFICGAFESLVRVSVKVEAKKYEKGIQWLNDLAWFSEFTPERLVIAAKKLLNDVPRNKRDGMKMTDMTLKTILYNESSNHIACNLINQSKFLTEIVKKIESDPNNVVDEINKLREILTHPNNIRIHVCGAIRKLSDPLSPWSQFKPKYKFNTPLPAMPPVQLSQQFLTTIGKSPRSSTSQPQQKHSKVVSMASIESGYLVGVAKGIGEFGHKDYAALSVLFEYFQTMEGVFWKQIRGPGLAYGASLSIDVHSALVRFTIYRSSDPLAAFTRAQSIIQEIQNGQVQLDESMIESAKSSFIFSLVNAEENAMKSGNMSFVNLELKRVEQFMNRKVLNEVKDITLSDLNRVLHTYLVPLFSASTSVLSVVCPPSKITEVKNGFEKLGYGMVQSDLDELVGIVGVEEEAESGSDDEEDDMESEDE